MALSGGGQGDPISRWPEVGATGMPPFSLFRLLCSQIYSTIEGGGENRDLWYHSRTFMRLTRNLPYWFLLSGSCLWIAAVWLAPWAAERAWPVAGWLYSFFSPICHQNPDRSFFCFGHPLATCHRCFGLYLGFTAGLLLLPDLHRLRRLLLEAPRTSLLLAAPMAADVFLWANTPTSRFLTGLVAAFPVSVFVWAAAEQLYRSYSDSKIEEPRCHPTS